MSGNGASGLRKIAKLGHRRKLEANVGPEKVQGRGSEIEIGDGLIPVLT